MNKPPIVEIRFEEGEATLEDTIKLYTEMVKAVSEWDFTPPEKKKRSKSFLTKNLAH